MTLVLTESDVHDLLPLAKAEEAVRQGFQLLANGQTFNFPRQRGGVEGALLNVMWAVSIELQSIGVKTYPVTRTDVSQGATSTLLLYSLPRGELTAIIEAELLGQRRTGAATAVASQHLARQDATVLTVIGAGWQASGQTQALIRSFPLLEKVNVVSRDTQRSQQFAERFAAHVPTPVVVAASAEDAVMEADLVVTTTGSSEPVLMGDWLRPGVHINAIGSNHASDAELDSVAIARSDLIVVDSRDDASIECGDLLRAGFDLQATIEMSEIVTGSHPGRTEDDQITLFESQGLAIEDLACAVSLLEDATRLGRGTHIDLGSQVRGDRYALPEF